MSQNGTWKEEADRANCRRRCFTAPTNEIKIERCACEEESAAARPAPPRPAHQSQLAHSVCAVCETEEERIRPQRPWTKIQGVPPNLVKHFFLFNLGRTGWGGGGRMSSCKAGRRRSTTNNERERESITSKNIWQSITRVANVQKKIRHHTRLNKIQKSGFLSLSLSLSL